ncbi:MAG: HAD family hydrolase [Thermodesulfobacteriota bacterium]
MKSPRAVFVTDLDGTLLSPDRTLAAENRAALETLGGSGIVRVVATGRSLYTFFTALPADLPIDYLIFSTGSGVLDFKARRIIRSGGITRGQALAASLAFLELGLDFCLYDPVPDNHRFSYHATGRSNPDFFAYLDRNGAFGRPMHRLPASSAGQILCIAPEWPGDGLMQELAPKLDGAKVVRATSPADHRSAWIEVLGASAGKAEAARWLTEEHLGLHGASTCAVGNDYNDRDLLSWAEEAFVTENAPASIRRIHATVPVERAVARAAAQWMGRRRSSLQG